MFTCLSLGWYVNDVEPITESYNYNYISTFYYVFITNSLITYQQLMSTMCYIISGKLCLVLFNLLCHYNWIGDKMCLCFRWCFNPKLLEVVDTSKMAIEIGDFVFVVNSYATVKALQDEDHGGWQEEMREVRISPFIE